MKLYSSPLSPFSARVRFSLYFKAIDFEPIKPSTLGGMRSPAFLAINPLGKIPVLELPDGARLCESDVIVEFLEDLVPAPALRPVDPVRRAASRLIARAADLYVLLPLLAGLAPMMPLAAGRKPDPRDPSRIQAESARVSSALSAMEGFLDGDGPFALGAEPSLADGALAPYLVFVEGAAEHLGQPGLLPPGGRLARYLDEAARAEPALLRVRDEVRQAMTDRRAEIEAAFSA